ncbi:hypothetical protein BDV93DRAFT_554109 [Ceratobasidium sp. AG-I]|nr:hypothetical protein BDV93DRAFT_554109 [Ceratobasidium sp. AG-I]
MGSYSYYPTVQNALLTPTFGQADISAKFAATCKPTAVDKAAKAAAHLAWINATKIHVPKCHSFKASHAYASIPFDAELRECSHDTPSMGYVAGDVKSVVVGPHDKVAREAGVKWVDYGWTVNLDSVNAWLKDKQEEWKTMVPEAYAGSIKDKDIDKYRGS